MATHAARQAARARWPAVPAGVPIPVPKITAPGVPDSALPRPRITKLIAQGTRWYPLTAVTAPAGAGKTMILALWAAAEPGPVAWVTADEFGNRPGVLRAYVVAALRRSGIAVPGALPAGRGRAGGRVFLLRVAAALAAQDLPVTLVLDDLHLLTDPRCPAGLTTCCGTHVLRLAKGLWARALRESSLPSLPLGAWGNRMCGCPEVFRGSGHGYQDLAEQGETQDEIQQAPHGPGRSMSSAPAGGGEPGIGSRRRSPATLVTRCWHRLLPAVKALRGAAAASRLGRA